MALRRLLCHPGSPAVAKALDSNAVNALFSLLAALGPLSEPFILPPGVPRATSPSSASSSAATSAAAASSTAVGGGAAGGAGSATGPIADSGSKTGGPSGAVVTSTDRSLLFSALRHALESLMFLAFDYGGKAACIADGAEGLACVAEYCRFAEGPGLERQVGAAAAGALMAVTSDDAVKEVLVHPDVGAIPSLCSLLDPKAGLVAMTYACRALAGLCAHPAARAQMVGYREGMDALDMMASVAKFCAPASAALHVIRWTA